MWTWIIDALSILKDERGFINFGFSQSKAGSEADSGVRGTSIFQPVVDQTGSSFQNLNRLASEASNAPFMTYRGQPINELMPTGRFGVSASADKAMEGLFRDQFARSSGSLARRGGMTPESFTGAVGSAGAEWAKGAIPQINSWQQYLAQLAPSLYGQNLGFANTPVAAGASLLGSRSVSSSSSLGMGGGVGGGSLMGGGGGAMCWVAESIYGKTAPETYLLRWYISGPITVSYTGRLFHNLYKKVGKRVAAWLDLHPTWKKPVKVLFDHILQRAICLKRVL